jgi:hypothetical protein
LEQLPAHLRQLPQASLLLPGRQHRTTAVVEHISAFTTKERK